MPSAVSGPEEVLLGGACLHGEDDMAPGQTHAVEVQRCHVVCNKTEPSERHPGQSSGSHKSSGRSFPLPVVSCSIKLQLYNAHVYVWSFPTSPALEGSDLSPDSFVPCTKLFAHRGRPLMT